MPRHAVRDPVYRGTGRSKSRRPDACPHRSPGCERPPNNSPNSTRGLLLYVQVLCNYAEKSLFIPVSPFRVWLDLVVRPQGPGERGKKHASREEIRKSTLYHEGTSRGRRLEGLEGQCAFSDSRRPSRTPGCGRGECSTCASMTSISRGGSFGLGAVRPATGIFMLPEVISSAGPCGSEPLGGHGVVSDTAGRPKR